MSVELAVQLASRLSQLAADYDRAADAHRRAGGAWSQVVAFEHARSAAQLRAVRDDVDPDDPRTLALASQWVHAAQTDLERIQPK